jgi:hypothetical protein
LRSTGRFEPAPGEPVRRPGACFIALYPTAWRRRYGDELAAMLEEVDITLRDRVDLVRGALDAYLHPPRPSMLPVMSALTAGALALAHAVAIAVQPTPPDWPGYLLDALPLAIGAVALLIPSVIGLWLRLGDGDGRLGRLGILTALAGHGAWLVALVAVILRVDYGATTAVAATVAMVGGAMLGVALAGRGATILGVLLVIASLAGVAPPAVGWPLFGAAWSAIGFRLLGDYRRRLDGPAGLTPA